MIDNEGQTATLYPTSSPECWRGPSWKPLVCPTFVHRPWSLPGG